MSLTVFLAMCILGCDVLIYFLYEWAFGESNRIRKRQTRARAWAASNGESLGYAERGEGPASNAARVIKLDRKRGSPAALYVRPDAHDERLAYRRLAAASLVQLKPRT